MQTNVASLGKKPISSFEKQTNKKWTQKRCKKNTYMVYVEVLESIRNTTWHTQDNNVSGTD